MKKYRFIVRQRIIDFEAKRIHDDFGLKALDGYYEEILSSETEESIDMLVSRFLEINPQYTGWDIEVVDEN